MSDQMMPDNYYEIKTLRLKVIYLLAGWAVFIFAWICFSNIFHEFLFEDPVVRILLEQIHLREESFTISFIAMATLLLLYILIFSNWICLRFRETWGLSIVFMCMTHLSSTAYFLLNVSLSPLQGFFCFSIFLLGILSIYQLIIFLPLFSIAYYLWVCRLKRRKNLVPLSQKTCAFLHYLNLIPVFGVGCLFYAILHLD